MQPYDRFRRRHSADRDALVCDPGQRGGCPAGTVQTSAVSVNPRLPTAGNIRADGVTPGHRADTTWLQHCQPWRLIAPSMEPTGVPHIQTGPVKEEPHKASPGDQLRTLARARASTDREDWERAAGLWAAVVAANPVDGSHWFQLGEARRHRQDLGGAIAAYEKALELRHAYPAETAYRIAASHAQLGQSDAALERLDQAMRLGLRDVAAARTGEEFADLRGNPRFRELVGLVDLDGISRDAGWRLDLGILAREVKRRAYRPFQLVSEERFDTEVQSIDASIPGLTDMQVIAAMSRLVALLADGHAGIQPPQNRSDLLKALPLLFYLFEEGLFVSGAEAARRDLLGARVLEIGKL